MSDTSARGVHVGLRHEEGFRFRVRFGDRGRTELSTDESPPVGQGEGPSPTMMLAAAVGNCLASSLLFCLQKSQLGVDDLEVAVELETGRNEQGRLRIHGIRARLAPSVSAAVEAKMTRCVELFQSFCVVTESVRGGIDVKVEVEPRRARAPAEPPS